MKKKYIIIGCMLFVFSFAAGCAAPQAEYVPSLVTRATLLFPHYKVAVLDLKMNTGSFDANASPLYEKTVDYSGGRLIASEIETILVQEKLFPVVERSSINKVLREHRLKAAGITANDSEIISLLNADGVWIGVVNDFSTYEQLIALMGKCSFSIKLVDTKTGTILYTFSASESAMGSPRMAMEKAMEKFRQDVYSIKIPDNKTTR